MSDNTSWKELFKKAIQYHDQGIEGNDQAVKKAYQLIEKVRAQAPENDLIEAYYGSIVALLGRDEEVDPMDRIEYAEKGLKILDRVVDDSPENEEIRTLRGYVCYKIPEDIFQRTNTAIKDFNYLITNYEKNNSQLSKDFYFQLLFDLGFAYETMGKYDQAKQTWKKLLSHSKQVAKYEKLLRNEGVDIKEL